jgi:hypothetical protein
MSNLDGGLGDFGADPGSELKGKGVPWPVYLAIGIAVLALVGFAGVHEVQKRNRRKLHVAFMEQFADFEKNQVNLFWRCLFGKDGDGRRFNAPEALNGAIESALFNDFKEFPTKVTGECVPKALKAAKGVTDFSPPAPTEYRVALDDYGKALAGLANTLNAWAEGAPKRVETKQREAKITQAGETWSTTANPAKADPDAWRYDKFLHCAVPDIDKFKDGQALLEFLATKCVANAKKGQSIDMDFLGKVRDNCIPDAQEPPAKTPPTFKGTFTKFAGDFDRMAQAWGTCFRKMNKESKKDDLDSFDKAWVQSLNASTEIRKIGKGQLTDE